MTDRLILGVCGLVCALYVVFGGKTAPSPAGSDAPVAVAPTTVTRSTPTNVRATPTPTAAKTHAVAPAGQTPTSAQMPEFQRRYAAGLLTSDDLPTATRFRADTVKRSPQGPGLLVRAFGSCSCGRSTATRVESISLPLDTEAHAIVFFRRPYGLQQLVRAQVNSHFPVAPVTGATVIRRLKLSPRADVVRIELEFGGESAMFAFARSGATIVGVGFTGSGPQLHAGDVMKLLARAVAHVSA